MVALAGELLLHVLRHPTVRAHAKRLATEAARQMVRYIQKRKLLLSANAPDIGGGGGDVGALP